uniref:Uncharacterized protein n=1 Tax=Vespula pensylvanica TaxID=30213 RepID=A0A834P1Y9_VESPE|nr:hypothetical protein H0235_009165 [Vespula pensylvanica]
MSRTSRTNVSENAIVGFRTIHRPSPINGDDDENEKAGIFLIGLQARAKGDTPFSSVATAAPSSLLQPPLLIPFPSEGNPSYSRNNESEESCRVHRLAGHKILGDVPSVPLRTYPT